jgi:hypothetical protein|tara:strand:- start:8414 stop:8527 length:114 start_codon:yes stop_codon:yes gene_type:complete
MHGIADKKLMRTEMSARQDGGAAFFAAQKVAFSKVRT